MSYWRQSVTGAPVTDWRQYDTIYTERYMGTPQENPQGYRYSSPVNFADGLQGKLLIAHATGDDIRKHLEVKISKIEMPTEIEFRDSLPKTMIGKLSKKELKAEEAARQKAKSAAQ